MIAEDVVREGRGAVHEAGLFISDLPSAEWIHFVDALLADRGRWRGLALDMGEGTADQLASAKKHGREPTGMCLICANRTRRQRQADLPTASRARADATPPAEIG